MIEQQNGMPILSLSVTGTAQFKATLSVEIGHTVPNSTANSLHGPGGTYAFAPTGDRSAKELVLNAIRTAQKFIYLEDQHLVDMSISNALVAALPHLQKLIILIVATEGVNGELREGWMRRKRFVDPFLQHGAGKVSICQLGGGRYVHAKMWIFDDRFAIIGSANVNRRGFTHDSEQVAGIFDGNQKRGLTFAHELRMNLWAKHLKRRHESECAETVRAVRRVEVSALGVAYTRWRDDAVAVDLTGGAYELAIEAARVAVTGAPAAGIQIVEFEYAGTKPLDPVFEHAPLRELSVGAEVEEIGALVQAYLYRCACGLAGTRRTWASPWQRHSRGSSTA